MTVVLDQLKNSLRVETTDDDIQLQNYIVSAQNYLINAIGTDDANNTFYSDSGNASLFDTAVIAIASGYYLYRTALSNQTAVPIDLATNSIISQLRAKWDVWQQSLTDGNSDGI
ncbi:head-tail connector protein [Oenococcus oeni]|uniref:head-tail connector protein n=1 Tax=Oenococcus oeni TaxID=1247 RepID=UPI0010BC588A|nr:head-tail connector protein [Oenococcus oeni]SYW16203.1 conserved hypothetical protein [Oenococcus oeni]